MMEGFGVHTFRLVNASGRTSLVKFHWKPVLGAHSLVWDEAQRISGKDPDFHRRDLWDAIECGQYPEYELGLQIMDEDQQLAGHSPGGGVDELREEGDREQDHLRVEQVGDGAAREGAAAANGDLLGLAGPHECGRTRGGIAHEVTRVTALASATG